MLATSRRSPLMLAPSSSAAAPCLEVTAGFPALPSAPGCAYGVAVSAGSARKPCNDRSGPVAGVLLRLGDVLLAPDLAPLTPAPGSSQRCSSSETRVLRSLTRSASSSSASSWSATAPSCSLMVGSAEELAVPLPAPPTGPRLLEPPLRPPAQAPRSSARRPERSSQASRRRAPASASTAETRWPSESVRSAMPLASAASRAQSTRWPSSASRSSKERMSRARSFETSARKASRVGTCAISKRSAMAP
mmetsp:Transcript_99153/g.319706  ORF Transcript_99153/g.319706 Transcript_99153/m.319706 type:complete len:248 (-) Transcript_99153:904-1647(-)